jgi:hypothetical protein
MAIGTTGPILFAGTIGVELGRSSTATISMSESAVYTLAGTLLGGQISFSTFYGKSASVTYNLTIASNTTNYNMATAAMSAGWMVGQTATINCTINSGVEVTSTSTGSYAFDTGSAFVGQPVTLNLTNNGTIAGKGGNGGHGSYNIVVNQSSVNAHGENGVAGGPSLIARQAITITNNGTIGGGGGGGGGGEVGISD